MDSFSRSVVACARMFVPAALALASGTPARAGVQFFTANPTANSTDFLAYAAGHSFAVDGSIDFSTHPDGGVVPDWYQASHGMTMSVEGAARVITGDGSLSGNTTDPDGIGEGVMPEPSRYLEMGSGAVTTIDFAFDAPVAGVGIMTADMFQWADGLVNASLEAFASDGTSLGLVNAVDADFEFDFLYFMGVTDDAGRISRVRFTDFGVHGDTVYLTRLYLAAKAGCACPADFNCDGFVTGDDYDAFVDEFIAGNPTADFNGDGFVTGDDFDAYVDAFEAGC